MQPGQLPKRPNRLVIVDDKARAGLLEGAKQLFLATSATYSPVSGNVVLVKNYGDPVVTHDGVTVARDIFLRDDVQNAGAVILKQASNTTNKNAGDGTTATVVLGYHLFNEAYKRVVAGESAMEIKRTLEKDVKKVIDFVKSKSVKADSKRLVQVASISSGDESVGALIANVVEEVGAAGSITLQEDLVPGIKVEKVGGYYFDKGFFALNTRVDYVTPHVIVTQKRLVSAMDILPIIKLAQASGNKRVVIVGDVSGDALTTVVGNILNGQWEAVVIPPPAYGDEAKLFLEDIAIYCGAKLFYEGDSFEKMTQNDFGSIKKSEVTQDRAILFNDKSAAQEGIDLRVEELQANLKDEKQANQRERTEQRLSKLLNKVTIIKVGGSTQSEMEELKFRVEDAIEATKAALTDGVLPGNATTLAWASKLDVHPILQNALNAPFLTLMENAGESGEYRLRQVFEKDYGYGFNVRNMKEDSDPQLLMDTGVLDATKAILQVVENGVSAANVLITAKAVVIPDDGDSTESTTSNN